MWYYICIYEKESPLTWLRPLSPCCGAGSREDCLLLSPLPLDFTKTWSVSHFVSGSLVLRILFADCWVVLGWAGLGWAGPRLTNNYLITEARRCKCSAGGDSKVTVQSAGRHQNVTSDPAAVIVIPQWHLMANWNGRERQRINSFVLSAALLRFCLKFGVKYCWRDGCIKYCNDFIWGLGEN